MKKRFIAFFLTAIFIFQNISTVSAITDDFIFVDPPQNTYKGQPESYDIIRNVDFADIDASNPIKESIVQSGALNLIKGEGRNFNPAGIVTKQEGIAFAVRAMGWENEAINRTTLLQATLPAGSNLQNAWYLGYMDVAQTQLMITPAEYLDALAADQSAASAITFRRTAPATREEIAGWLVAALSSVDPTIFTTTSSMQSIYEYSDWTSISPNRAVAVEALLSNGVMTGSNGQFRPQGNVSRSEMATILRNLDSIYFRAMGIERISGTVGGIQYNQTAQTGNADASRDYYIRKEDGGIDIIQLIYQVNSSPQSAYLDAPVLKDGNVSGLIELEEGDQIEYLVETLTNEVLFVNVRGTLTENDVSGELSKVDLNTKMITIIDSEGRSFSYPFAAGIILNQDGVDYISIGSERVDVTKLPYGRRCILTLTNNIVTAIEYVGEPLVYSEVRGVVIENNPQFSYLTIVNNNGQKLDYEYLSGSLTVEKQQHYDMMDEVGYFDEIFPSFVYDPRDSIISEIEPGDIVFIRPDSQNPSMILSISAATNYVMKYGKIVQLTNNGTVLQMLVEYENKQTAWFDVSTLIPVSKDGYPTTTSTAKVGDWVKLLVNQAILGPGYIQESVKEIVLEGDEHFISTIVKGQLAGINGIQNQLMIQNAQTLSKTGWTNYRQIQEYSLAGRDIEFYNGNQRISLDYALQYLKRATGDVYLALENNYAGDQIRKVTFRQGRDEVLDSDTIVHSDGSGTFMFSNASPILTDEGTIVRRYGRLVDGQNIMFPDYAMVTLNGAGMAAVVDIVDAPDTSGIMIARGRIQSVEQNSNFTVQSMSLLTGMEWQYTPVQREFAIDYNTLFLDENGFVDQNTFLDYTDTSVVDQVFNVVIDGSRAARVVNSGYAQDCIRGTVYAVDGNVVNIRDAQYYNSDNGTWNRISNSNNIAVVNLIPSSIIAKNNQIVNPADLLVGDQLRVMTTELPTEKVSGMEVEGTIIFVEK